MVKRPVVIATRSIIGKSQAEFQNVFNDMAADDLGAFIITATGPRNGAVFAGSFRKVSHIPLTRSNLSKAEFVALNAQQHDAGAILIRADSFPPDDPRYCAIWGPNPGDVACGISTRWTTTAPLLQQRYEAMKGVGASISPNIR